MDTDVLVEDRIEDGRKLLRQLVRNNFDVTAAAWIKTGDDERWALYVASKRVDEQGPTAAYRDAYGVLQGMAEPHVSMFEVKLIGANDPITRDLLKIQARQSARRPARYPGPLLGQLAIEEAYIYPPPSADEDSRTASFPGEGILGGRSMLVPRTFDAGEVTFEIVKPFFPDREGKLLESDQWMVRIHPGTVSWLLGGPLLDPKTRRTALFATPEEALRAAIDFAHERGLRDV